MQDAKFKGLGIKEVEASRAKFGYNRIETKKEYPVLISLKKALFEPMVLLLLAASSIYFISGKTNDGIFLSCAILLVAGISLYQEKRSRNALDSLRKFTEPLAHAVRDSQLVDIPMEEVVVDDLLRLSEGEKIGADGVLLEAHDFSVNESMLTGESLAVYKSLEGTDLQVFSGTQVTTGSALIRVVAIGNTTRLGKIGGALAAIQEEKTPLELQINSFVRKLVYFGAFVFLLVWVLNYLQSYQLLDSLLKSLTLAMSILPEEIPVAFATFMALGAWRLMKTGVIVKQMKTVETLGSATVICTDKTGTITENRMTLSKLFVASGNQVVDFEKAQPAQITALLRVAMLASEEMPFDPMEAALHRAYEQVITKDERPFFHKVFEYPLAGKPPMMTHVYERDGKLFVTAKGAPEAIMNLLPSSSYDQAATKNALKQFSLEGLRVLAVAEADHRGGSFPVTQEEYKFRLVGLVSFYDPPKKNIADVFKQFYQAGIQVKIITGDNAATTSTIARQVGLKDSERATTGDELMKLSDDELKKEVQDVNIFTRMFPEAKLRIVEMLKSNGEIVAMTGDGVNDGPALKAAHIGIAMGKRGTEVARQAASLVLIDDDLAKMADAVAAGRRIYTNLKKAIRYIISIHIPILLVVFVPLVLGWVYPVIFSPVHVIFLELIMGPTCSIIYENEPMESHMMNRKPRAFSDTFFSWRELTVSIVQGLVIAAGVLFLYQAAVRHGVDEPTTRAMVFTGLIAANVLLTLVNRSFRDSLIVSMTYRNSLIWMVIGITVLLTAALLYVPMFQRLFEFGQPAIAHLAVSVVIGWLSVIWFEVAKWVMRMEFFSR